LRLEQGMPTGTMQCRTSRRTVLRRGFALSASAAFPATVLLAAEGRLAPARMRVIVDNDFGGDPDGLFQLAHFALSRSIAIPLIVGSQYKDFGPADLVPDKAKASVEKAGELLSAIPRIARPPIITGSPRPLQSRNDGLGDATSLAIVREAMRSDAAMPLFYAAGGSLTEIARAWLTEPRIGPRMRLVWIGGAEHPDLAKPPPGPGEAEYNFSLDRLAAQIVFNESNIEIWQVPRNAFRQMLFSLAEVDELKRSGRLGRYLHLQVHESRRKLAGNLPSFIFDEGDAITLGDTALVTLTALQSAFQPDTASSSYAVRPTPQLLENGNYRPNPGGRAMRVYNAIDAGLTFRDMLAKFRQN
jgi:purine nucleosidase